MLHCFAHWFNLLLIPCYFAAWLMTDVSCNQSQEIWVILQRNSEVRQDCPILSICLSVCLSVYVFSLIPMSNSATNLAIWHLDIWSVGEKIIQPFCKAYIPNFHTFYWMFCLTSFYVFLINACYIWLVCKVCKVTIRGGGMEERGICTHEAPRCALPVRFFLLPFPQGEGNNSRLVVQFLSVYCL